MTRITVILAKKILYEIIPQPLLPFNNLFSFIRGDAKPAGYGTDFKVLRGIQPEMTLKRL